jgi:hypothetical protein
MTPTDITNRVPCPPPLAGIAFSFTPLKRNGPPGTPGTPSFTPGKVLLANGETRMNMLSPACDNTKLFHADVEYQKIVSEWTFQKDTVDIPQVRISTLWIEAVACVCWEWFPVCVKNLVWKLEPFAKAF